MLSKICSLVLRPGYLLFSCSLVIAGCANKAELVPPLNLIPVQTLIDNQDGVDGLDNPRNINLSSDFSKLFLVSGDDNAVVVIDVEKDYDLESRQLFKNANANIQGLEGASQVALSENGSLAFVTGFYDGALVTFKLSEQQLYRYSRIWSDNLAPARVFESGSDLSALDKLGLLGAWDVAVSGNDIYVASYKSNAISHFKEDDNSIVNHIGVLRNTHFDLGSPVSLAISPNEQEVIVAGFEKHILNIFSKTAGGQLEFQQSLTNDNGLQGKCLNPQKITYNKNGELLYLACSGSSSLLVLKNVNGTYRLIQTVSYEQTGLQALKGVTTISISPKQKWLLAAAETGEGVALFSIDNNGMISSLAFQHEPVDTADHLQGVTSIMFLKDDNHFAISSAKHDSLSVYRIEKN